MKLILKIVFLLFSNLIDLFWKYILDMQCSDFFLRKHAICNLKNLRYIEQRKKEDEECEKEPKGWAVGEGMIIC